jgi:2-keto-4-pentenoate hydratase/2-oxohepta-3-ene-1,7-dioic acid hydratase in catechol pathway
VTKILRFVERSANTGSSEPKFGILKSENVIRAVASDPLYAGISLRDEVFTLDEVRLLAPVIPRSKVVCVGKNYADHAAEMGGEVPKQPIIFIKPNTTVIGPEETIVWPKESERVDHEAELAIVISKICRYVPRDKYKDVIFGYTLANDVTARDIQKIDGQWTRAKGFDTFCPLGPWIDTDFEPGDQVITCFVGDEKHQEAKLSDMFFKVPEIIEFISSVMTLLPGDVILTGTPAGISPLQRGGRVRVSIEGLGSLSNQVSK